MPQLLPLNTKEAAPKDRPIVKETIRERDKTVVASHWVVALAEKPVQPLLLVGLFLVPLAGLAEAEVAQTAQQGV